MNENEHVDHALMALEDVLKTQLFLAQFDGASAESRWHEDNQDLLAQQLKALWQALSALADDDD